MQDLVRQASRGDRDAFAVLATGSIDHLFAVARRILQDHDLAEDAVQAALVTAWRDLPSLRDTACFDAWLNRLIVHACYDEGRRQKSLKAHVRVLNFDPPAPDPVQLVSDRDELERAFCRLTLEQRAVVVLHFYAGLSLKEVAEALGVPEGTARSRLHYALRVVRAAIEADERPVPVQRRMA